MFNADACFDVGKPLSQMDAFNAPVRLSTRIFALVLCPVILVVLAILWLVVVPIQGRPFLFTSERMKTPTRGFRLIKIRTMTPRHDAAEVGAPGQEELQRVTPVGRILRRFRLDELPQIFNVIRGDIGFIGPRPPLRRHVLACPTLYRQVLRQRPGITGLATVLVHRREERILSRCGSGEETEEVYLRRCVPLKARIDLIYFHRKSTKLDLFILLKTFVCLAPVWRRGSRNFERNRLRMTLPRSAKRGAEPLPNLTLEFSQCGSQPE